MTPACGPPSSLSPLNSVRSAPAAMLSRGSGSPGRPSRAKSKSAPLPASSITGTPCFLPSATSSARETDFVKPDTR